MRIGYSMWGFLGNGVLDTPDGSRAYRKPFIDGLAAYGHDIVLLQCNRDLHEADIHIGQYTWDEAGLPELDAILFEWRWPLPGRNTTTCGSVEHTRALHRQNELIEHYTRQGVPTLIWDLDRQLPEADPLRHLRNVIVGEFALLPTPGAVQLFCPVPDALLDAADPQALAARPRPTALVYVGNQYDRDGAFDRYFASAAACVPHQVAGKWTHTQAWPHVTFIGRCGFEQVAQIYSGALATVMLLPERYARVGHMTSRWFEALLAGCLPLVPTEMYGADAFVPTTLQITTGRDVIDKLAWLRGLAGGKEHADLLAACLSYLEHFRCSAQVAVAIKTLEGCHDHWPGVSQHRRRVLRGAPLATQGGVT